MLDSPVFKIVYAIRMATRKNGKGKRQRKCYRNGPMQGGALGQGYMNGSEMLARGYPVVQAYNSCGALSRPGILTTAEISGFKGGLPGLSGGSRRMRKGRRGTHRMRKGRRRGTHRMRGGRYGMALEGPEFSALGPRGGMMATAERIACESGVAPHVSQTTPTEPPVMKGGAALQLAPMPVMSGGGALQLAPSPVMSGGGALHLSPTPFLQEQTAGYSQSPSQFLNAVGAPILLNIPEGGRMGVPACSQTGGGRRRRRQYGGEGVNFKPLTDAIHGVLYLRHRDDCYFRFYGMGSGEEVKKAEAAKLRAVLDKNGIFMSNDNIGRVKGYFMKIMQDGYNLKEKELREILTDELYDKIFAADAVMPDITCGPIERPPTAAAFGFGAAPSAQAATAEPAAEEAPPAPAFGAAAAQVASAANPNGAAPPSGFNFSAAFSQEAHNTKSVGGDPNKPSPFNTPSKKATNKTPTGSTPQNVRGGRRTQRKSRKQRKQRKH